MCFTNWYGDGSVADPDRGDRHGRAASLPRHPALGEDGRDQRPRPGPAGRHHPPRRPCTGWPHAHRRTRRATAMTMPPGLRKLVLTVHLTSSVGWIGAVVAYLALGVSAVTRQDA